MCRAKFSVIPVKFVVCSESVFVTVRHEMWKASVVALAVGLPTAASKSQSGQDTVIRKIFDVIGTTQRQYVEVGFNTNAQCVGSGANTCALWQQGWTGLLLDGDHSNASINLHKEYLTSANIVHLLGKYQVPLAVDYISVDIDSADLWIIRAILASRYRPRLLSVEYNSNFPWHYALTYPDETQFAPAAMALEDRIQHEELGIATHNCFVGGSGRAMQMVAEAAGYSLVAAVPPLDLFFAPTEVVETHKERLSALLKDRWYLSRPTKEFLKQGVPLNSWGFKAMKVEQALELIDYAVYTKQLHQGKSASAAAQAARLAARPQIRELAGKNVRCFRNLRNLTGSDVPARLHDRRDFNSGDVPGGRNRRHFDRVNVANASRQLAARRLD